MKQIFIVHYTVNGWYHTTQVKAEDEHTAESMLLSYCAQRGLSACIHRTLRSDE